MSLASAMEQAGASITSSPAMTRSPTSRPPGLVTARPWEKSRCFAWSEKLNASINSAERDLDRYRPEFSYTPAM